MKGDDAKLAGKTIKVAVAECDKLDAGDDTLTIQFTDGTCFEIRGQWCNDGSGALSFEWLEE